MPPEPNPRNAIPDATPDRSTLDSILAETGNATSQAPETAASEGFAAVAAELDGASTPHEGMPDPHNAGTGDEPVEAAVDPNAAASVAAGDSKTLGQQGIPEAVAKQAATPEGGVGTAEEVGEEQAGKGGRNGGGVRSVSVPLSAIAVGAGVVVLVAGLAVACFGWWSARDEVEGMRSGAAGERHAEQVATDYAVGASTIDHQNVAAWVSKLKANTSPQLANKFDATAPKLEEILLPLKWTSTAVPIAAKVASASGGVYKVNVFVDVTSTNAQNPKGGQMTVTYNVTVDSNGGWQITDVGGLDGALPTR
ncbi:hypothetical protein [Nocardia wallacei]|uniref:hypothetical protein n=1 Tax=Nocardia wallacei TaxID=480035 RepID=UPI0024571C07|nr:hypothetical protein [Nocardia wallacei]